MATTDLAPPTTQDQLTQPAPIQPDQGILQSQTTPTQTASTAPSGTEDFVVRKVGFQRGSNTIAVNLSLDFGTLKP